MAQCVDGPLLAYPIDSGRGRDARHSCVHGAVLTRGVLELLRGLHYTLVTLSAMGCRWLPHYWNLFEIPLNSSLARSVWF